jgi:ABC-type nitrate/sulfonate/bicarbonate transport system permease component
MRNQMIDAMLRSIAQPRASRLSERALRAGLRVSSLIVFALGWELLARRLDSLLLPGFVETMVALARLIATPLLWQAVWISNQAMLLGFSLAAFVGILLGLLMGRYRALERYADPYLNILLVTPMSALIPILIMATGLGLLSRVLVIFTFAVVVVTVNVRAGLRMVDPTWTEMARSFGASELQLWRRVLLPGALPGIATGLRLGLARAVSGMITVELLLIALGIGRLILDFQGTFESANLYATVLVVVAEAVILLQAGKWLEQRIAPWREEGAAR